MLYTGYFRNTDISVDPKGQLYKVEIFTNGELYTYHQLTNTQTTWYNITELPEEQSLTLSGTPFTVEYTNDNNNKYKAYKGSTAEVGLVLDNYNFISHGKCQIYVRLLKWKNEVVYQNASVLVNTETSEHLAKTRIIEHKIVSGTELQKTIYYDFIPEYVDSFAYEVEWCGFATPNVYSQPYTKIIEEFTLQCQDVLTTLQYYDYHSEINGITSFQDSIKQSLNQLPNNPIKYIYVTDSVNQAQEFPSSILQQISSINDNWIDESYERKNCLEVISNIMEYLGLTIIQYKDSLYVTTPDAIGKGLKFYYRHDITFINHGWNHILPQRGSANASWVLVGKDINISDNELGASDTKLSTTSTYKKVSLNTDEYYEDNLLINITNDDNLVERFRWDDTLGYMKAYDSDRNIFSHDWPYNYDVENATAQYSGSCYDIAENDVDDTNIASIQQWYYPRDTKSGNYVNQSFTTTSAPQSRSDLFYKVGCSIVDYNATELSDNNAMADYLKSYNGKRCFLFHNTFPQVSASVFGLCVCPLMLDTSKINDYSKAQHVLKFKSKKCYIKSDQSIQIKGNLKFYQNITLPLESGWTFDELLGYKSYMFIWCRIKVHNDANNTDYYVVNDGSVTGKYTWSTTPSWFKLWYDNFVGYNRDADSNDRGTTTAYAFDTQYQFNKNTRGADGTIIRFPDAFEGGEYQQIEFDMRRPWGCGREDKITSETHFYPAQYTVMTDFSMNVIDADEEEYRYESEDNNEFKSEINNLAVDDFNTSSLLISSDYYKNTSKSTVIGLNGDMILTNSATGAGLLPEANYLYGITKSYATSKLKLNITLPFDVTPFDRITWSTQLANKNFAVDKMTIDYAYSDYQLSLIEITLDDITPVIWGAKRTKNFRRNGDNLYNPLPKRNKKLIQSPTESPLNRPSNFSFTVNEYDQVNFVSNRNSLLKLLKFEPYDTTSLILTVPDYMEYDSSHPFRQYVEPSINSNGELVLVYNWSRINN